MRKKTSPAVSREKFDLAVYLANINAADPLRIVLGAHLYVEAVLGQLISTVVPYPDALKLAGRRFDERLTIASALGLIHPSELTAYKALNDLRNELAHGLAHMVTVGEVRGLIRSLSEDQRRMLSKVVGGEPKAGLHLQPLLVLLFATLQSRLDSLPDSARLAPSQTWTGKVDATASRLESPSASVQQPAPTSGKLSYLAYGSNMSTKRLEKRLGSVEKVGIGKLPGYAIAFDKRSTDGTGKTNIVPRKAAGVFGVVFALSPEQLTKLAGLEKGYSEQEITVSIGGKAATVRTFVAQKRERGLRPTRKYLGYLVDGAREHKLPTSYVKKLERVKTTDL